MRHLAIDLGDKRTGLAISDPSGTFVSPLDVIELTEDRLIEHIVSVAREEGVGRVVVGLPINMDGTLGPRARSVIAFARKLEAKLGSAVIFVDERLSSFDAEQQLVDHKRRGAKLTRGDKKKRLDALAAASFLRGYLEGSLKAIDVDAP